MSHSVHFFHPTLENAQWKGFWAPGNGMYELLFISVVFNYLDKNLCPIFFKYCKEAFNDTLSEIFPDQFKYGEMWAEPSFDPSNRFPNSESYIIFDGLQRHLVDVKADKWAPELVKLLNFTSREKYVTQLEKLVELWGKWLSFQSKEKLN